MFPDGTQIPTHSRNVCVAAKQRRTYQTLWRVKFLDWKQVCHKLRREKKRERKENSLLKGRT